MKITILTTALLIGLQATRAQGADNTAAVKADMRTMIELLQAKKTEELMTKHVDPKMVAQIRSIKRYDQTIKLWQGKPGDDMRENLTKCLALPLTFSDGDKKAVCKIDGSSSMIFRLIGKQWDLSS